MNKKRSYKKRQLKNANEIKKVTLQILFASCTWFAPIEFPTRLQVASCNPSGTMNIVAAIY